MKSAGVWKFLTIAIVLVSISSPVWSTGGRILLDGEGKYDFTRYKWCPSGFSELINSGSCSFGFWTNACNSYYFRGTTQEVNEFLVGYSEIEGIKRKLTIHPASTRYNFGTVFGFKKEERYDWSVRICDPELGSRNPYKDQDPESSVPMSLYLGDGGIVEDDLVIPENVEVEDKQPEKISPEYMGKSVLCGRVYDLEDESPISDAKLVFLQRNDSRKRKEQFRIGMNESGTCLVTGVSPGNYTLKLVAEGYADRSAGFFRTDVPEVFEIDGCLARSNSISGVVTDTGGGQPIEGAVVGIHETYTMDRERYPFAGIASATSDRQGKFVMYGLPAGSALLFCNPGRWAMTGSFFQMVPCPSEDVHFVLQGTGTIHGRLLEKDGRPSTRNADVRIYPPGNVYGGMGIPGTLAVGGTFKFEKLKPGEYSVSARTDTKDRIIEPQATNILVESGETAEVTITLDPEE